MIRFVISLLVALSGIFAFANENLVYMLRLDDEIGSSTWRYTRGPFRTEVGF